MPQSRERAHTIKSVIELARRQLLEHVPAGRERSLALTNLEQAEMWAYKALFVADQNGRDGVTVPA